MLCQVCRDLFALLISHEAQESSNIPYQTYNGLQRNRVECALCARALESMPRPESEKQYLERFLLLVTAGDNPALPLMDRTIRVSCRKDFSRAKWKLLSLYVPSDIIWNGTSIGWKPVDENFTFFEQQAEQKRERPTQSSLATGSSRRLSSRLEDFRRSVPHIQRWIKACDETHRACAVHAGRHSWLPTRLVRISKSGSGTIMARLCSKATLNVNSRYMTLSHRWGTDGFLTLQERNYDEFLQSIPVERLPQTFQDAFQATLELGVDLLWLDSLCIIQDSSQDWEREAASMGLVYSNSYLNLAASASKRASEGLFRRMSPGIDIDCAFTTHTGQVYQLSERARDHLHESNFQQSPLHERAWVIQELFLARRTLHFTDLSLWWQCKCMVFRQICGSEDIHTPTTRTLNNVYLMGSSPDWQNTWYGLVNDYSCCNLSHITDKTFAVLGLVQFFHRSAGTEYQKADYFAGLWRRSLAYDLLWTPLDDPGREDRAAIPVFRGSHPARQYIPSIGPSWSWLSYHGPVEWEWPSIADRQSYVPSLYDIEIKGQTQGREAGPAIRFRACSINYQNVSIRSEYAHVLLGRMKESSSITVKIQLDSREQAPELDDCHLVTTVRSRSQIGAQRGLIVRKASAEWSNPVQRLPAWNYTYYMRCGTWVFDGFQGLKQSDREREVEALRKRQELRYYVLV